MLLLCYSFSFCIICYRFTVKLLISSVSVYVYVACRFDKLSHVILQYTEIDSYIEYDIRYNTRYTIYTFYTVVWVCWLLSDYGAIYVHLKNVSFVDCKKKKIIYTHICIEKTVPDCFVIWNYFWIDGYCQYFEPSNFDAQQVFLYSIHKRFFFWIEEFNS